MGLPLLMAAVSFCRARLFTHDLLRHLALFMERREDTVLEVELVDSPVFLRIEELLGRAVEEIALWRRRSWSAAASLLVDTADLVDAWTLLLQLPMVAGAVTDGYSEFRLASDVKQSMDPGPLWSALLFAIGLAGTRILLVPCCLPWSFRPNIVPVTPVNHYKVFYLFMRNELPHPNTNAHAALLAGLSMALVDAPLLILRLVSFFGLCIFPSGMVIKNCVCLGYHSVVLYLCFQWRQDIDDLADTYQPEFTQMERRVQEMIAPQGQADVDDVLGPYSDGEAAVLGKYTHDVQHKLLVKLLSR
mmetsp:Transcript_20167/g.44732  ORF Transcript_20167/g.44732 Transcript_20167/m.44732 type:complete len:303 (-) Transcript_20167:79-987(-)